MKNSSNFIGIHIIKSKKHKVKTGKNIFARVTNCTKGNEEHPNRKLGEGSGSHRKFTTEEMQTPVTPSSK